MKVLMTMQLFRKALIRLSGLSPNIPDDNTYTPM